MTCLSGRTDSSVEGFLFDSLGGDLKMMKFDWYSTEWDGRMQVRYVK